MRSELFFARSLAMGRLTEGKAPLIAAIEVTRRCNLTCRYCDVSRKQSDDLGTQEIKDIVTGLAELGTYSVNFDGGEPLMRKDIGEIVEHTRRLGVKANLNSNGVLFPRRAQELRPLNRIKFSLDGPRDVTDAVRGKGVFDAVVLAVQTAKALPIRVGLTAVISRRNVGRVMEMAEAARSLEVPVMFQPCANQVDVKALNPRNESPDPEDYRRAIRQLMSAKRSNPFIGNRMVGLKHLIQWPHPTSIPCYAGRFFLTIDHKGKMYSCGRLDRRRAPAVDVVELGVARAIEKLHEAGGCPHCWCARRAESNLLFHLNPTAALGHYPYGRAHLENPPGSSDAARAVVDAA